MAVIVGQGISVSPVPDAKLSHESTGTVQNKAVADAIAAEYSTSKTYSVGDVCTYDGKLYECIVDIPTAEGWTLAHWKVSNLGDVASDLNRQLSDLEDSISDAYDATASYAVGDFCINENTLYRCNTAIPTGGEAWTPAHWDAVQIVDLLGSGGGDVTDVQINGTSILRNGVANIPIGSGLIYNTGTNKINLCQTSAQFYKTGNSADAVIINHQHESAFYGLAKAAGDITQSASANAVGAYTEDAKSAIHTMLNAPVTVSGTTPTIAAKDGITYICGEVATLDITLPASGCFDVIFQSGSTPTVLTATGVTWMNGFDSTALEANKTYEINILNGLGVAGWT